MSPTQLVIYRWFEDKLVAYANGRLTSETQGGRILAVVKPISVVIDNHVVWL